MLIDSEGEWPPKQVQLECWWITRYSFSTVTQISPLICAVYSVFVILRQAVTKDLISDHLLSSTGAGWYLAGVRMVILQGYECPVWDVPLREKIDMKYLLPLSLVIHANIVIHSPHLLHDLAVW